MGSNAHPTLTVLKKFVRSHPGGIIFLDQLHQSAPRGDMQAWWHNVVSEILAVLDGGDMLISSGWSRADADHLRRNFFTIGASTRNTQKGHAQWISEDYGIPEEIAKRFNARAILLDLPSRKEYRAAILRVNADFGVQEVDEAEIKRLVDGAVTAKVGMRFVEQYVSDLAATKGLKPKPLTPSDTIRKRTPISAAAFAELTRNCYRLMEEAEPYVAMAKAHFGLLALEICKTEIGPTLDLLDDKLTPEFLSENFDDLLFGLGYRFYIHPVDQLNRETKFWKAGRLIKFFLEHLLENQAPYLSSHKMLGLASNTHCRLSRAMWAWHQLTTFSIDD